MKFCALLILGIIIVRGLTSCSKSSPESNKDHHVILISIDGFPAWLWNDESLQIPNLRKLAAEGASTKAMTVSNPSITWINHTTLVTGVEPRKHGVLFNGLLVRQGDNKPPKIEPWVDKSKLVHVPTLYDIAFQNGLTTAESDWVAVTRPGTITWSFAELPEAESPVVKEMIAAGKIKPEHIAWMQLGPQRKSVTFLDNMWTQAAIHIFKTHKPNLLLYHTLNTDATHHSYGPGSMASHTALAYADRLVGDLIKAVDESGLRDKTTFVIATDHGFKKVTKIILPNVVLKKAGLAQGIGPTINTCDAYAMTQGGMAFVYVTNPARKAELLPKLKEMFAQTEGVDRVIDGAEGHTLGMPVPEENQGMGDLVLYAKAGYAFKNDAGGDAAVVPSVGYAGTHGYFNGDPELDGIFIASGRGIKKGAVLDRMANLDVAPTIAKLMDLKLPDADGHVLEEILISTDKK
ncbi:alkaline phosphatase family protein [Prosthecobacter sp.]|uniref:alkaline phosphatase family protein n=1 Tax=Prosthecobacter sp. TaxID=1965333 RepID=UPI001D56FA92|nr:alkaline phosphatase family protein [Prosthecobacter sp.]MCB1277276.1 alkaline phosphatase family protein [Prosthecobacter sp.]